MSGSSPNILPLQINSTNCPEKLFFGLGKATRRGIKKCTKCGSYNGTRSAICKNKQCGVYLKDESDKHKELDAVKLLTGTTRQVYSVKVRDLGPDYRGFVQLPLLDDTNIALCFVDSCRRLFDDSILKCHEEDGQSSGSSVCVHIKAAWKSRSLAAGVGFKQEVLDGLDVEAEVRDKLGALAKTEGPLVQRVSKSVMAVKCQATPKHPLGYLHFTFGRKGKELYEKYFCGCTETNNSKFMATPKCIHYYACICALASDSQYLMEFFNFISTAMPSSKEIPSTIKQVSTKQGEQEKIAKSPEQKLKKAKLKKGFKTTILKKNKTLIPKVFPVEIKVLSDNPASIDSPSCESCNWKFLDWLSFVTESINNTMKFESSGVLNTLIFHIPEDFYACFKPRIPVVYCSNQRSSKDAAAYYIMNILHLKEIFDTNKVKLRISQKFIQTEQNGYMEYESDEHVDLSYKSTFIFFLNVGQSTVDESDNTNNSFVIEWLPNITSLMDIGQLKLQYKYGRKST